MLYSNVFVDKGVIFIRFDGLVNVETIDELERTINYLLYNVGVKYFVLDFMRTTFDKKIISAVNNKLLEVYAHADKMILKGLDSNNLFDLSFVEAGAYL